MISIIIPTLNEEKLIKDLLQNLFTYKSSNNIDFEIILSDGNSKDNTVQIAREYCDKIIVYPFNNKQKISEGKNLGAEISEGDYLIFLCADCKFKDINKFFNFVQTKFIYSRALAATFKFEVFPEERQLSDSLFHGFYNNYVRIINFLGLGMGRGECHLIKRDVFFKLNGFDSNLAAGEDFDLYKRIRKLGKILVSFENVIYESPRRYRKYGYKRVFYLWLINALNVMKLTKKMSEVWEEVR